MSYKVIGAIGDSITNGYWDEEGLGWFGRLSTRVAKTFPLDYGFNNMSQDGDRVCDAYHRVAYELGTRGADVLLIAIGINDIIRSPKADAAQDMSEHLREEYWHRMLDLTLKSEAKIVVLDILPIIEEWCPFQGCFNVPGYENNADIKKYNKIIEKICKEKKVKFFKRHEKWAKRDLKEFYKDNCHPNGDGHQLIADEVFAELVRLKLIG